MSLSAEVYDSITSEPMEKIEEDIIRDEVELSSIKVKT